MSFSAIAIALGSGIVEALAQQALDTAAGSVASQAQEKLVEKFKRGQFGVIQGALEGARDDLVAECERLEQREMVTRVLDRLLESHSGALLDEFTVQVTQVYLFPTPEGPPTASLARLYRKHEGVVAVLRGQVPSEAALTELLAAFFTAFRERLLREPDFAYLREYFQLTETREQSDLLKGVLGHLEEIAANTARPVVDLSGLRQEYFDYLIREHKDHVIRGFSPRVSGRDVSLPLAKIFLPLEAIEGRPALAEYAEEDMLRQAISGSMGELDWQRHTLEMEKRSAQLGARLAAQRALTLAELLDSSRAVLLGDPGTGKTTVTCYITYALAAGDRTHIGRRVLGLTPVLIRLANYGQAFEGDRTMHLIEYVEQELTPRFGPYLRQAIENGHCLIILDGLDEVTDPTLRTRVTERIQTMVASYHHNRFLVTSRIIGYDRSPLTREFKHATLKELDQENKARFVRLWYEALQAEMSGSIRGDRADDLIRVLQSKPQIGRLGANPLLLTIMVLMHSRGVKLPNRRVELYQNATQTLIEYWTTHRDFEIELDAHEIKAILAPIAYRILSSNVGGVIGHYDLLPKFHDGIVEQRGCNRVQARRLGRELLRALGEQSGIFLERGLDANGQPVYGFLHQTFGEYLAARHIAGEVLSGTFQIETHIHRTMWHEPLLLAAGYLSFLVTPTHLTYLIRQILNFDAPYEEQLQRNLLLVADFLADDIYIIPVLCREILSKLAKLLQHKAPQVRNAAVKDYHRLATTRHRDAAISTLKRTLDQIEDIDKLKPKIRFDIAQALVHLDQQELAKPLLWPLESERYKGEIRQDKVQRLRVEGWPDQAADYLCQLHADKNEGLYISPDTKLSDFILGPVDAASARRILGEDNLLNLIDALVNNSKDKKERANLRLLAALVPEKANIEALTGLIVPETPVETRCLAAIRLLESQQRPEAIVTLLDLMATEPKQAPQAAQALLAIDETANLDWQLLRDMTLIGDNDGAPQAIVTLLQAGEVATAIPAALHLLAVYPPDTRSQREVRLWPVVEALIEHGHTAIGLSAARWLALRPGYSFRLQACEALFKAGQVESTIPLFQYLAYECHDESSQNACQRLLLLKEAERLVPLLAQLSNSDVPETCYHACLALALAEHPPETCTAVARPRHKLKVSILDERLQAYQDALQKFCQAGFEALDSLGAADEQSQAFQVIARLGLSMLSQSGVASEQSDTISDLLNSPSPAVVVNAALFDLRAGRFERTHESLLNLLDGTTQPLSLPVHLKALTTLGQIVSPESTTVLLEALEDEHSRVRQRAARALGPLGDPAAVQPLLTALHDENEVLRRFAARALSEIGDPASIQPLIAALNDEDESMRSFAATALGRFGDPVALLPLTAALHDEFDQVRVSAIRALGELHTQEVVQLLFAALEDKSSQVRWSAVDALGELDDPTVVPPLIAILKEDVNAIVRWSAAQSLGQLGDSAAVQPLIAALKDEDEFVRYIAAEALSKFGNEVSITETLSTALNDQNSEIHTLAAVTLGLMGNPMATQPLIDALNNDEKWTRRFAVRALRQRGDPNSTQIFVAALYDEELGVRQLAALALKRFDDSSAIPHLIATLGDERSVVRSAAIDALAELGDSTICKSLMAIEYENNPERWSMVEAISRLGMREYTPLLVATSVASHRVGASQYATALIHLEPSKALPLLDRYEQQFRRASSMKELRGQAMWQLGDMEAALTSFRQAVEQKEDIDNLLALAHFHLEEGELQRASEHIKRVLEKARHEERAICLLSQAVVQWLMGEAEEGLATLRRAMQRNRHLARIKDLQYDRFWREKAITALQAMLAELESQNS
ncbi:MAG: HEAT repeat domain-containing protein [Ardenticatenaceae bacterium]